MDSIKNAIGFGIGAGIAIGATRMLSKTISEYDPLTGKKKRKKKYKR